MFWKSKTKEQKIQKRIDSVFDELTSDIDFEFSELETVQILNEVRRKLTDNLKAKHNENISKSLEHNQKAKEIENVINIIE